MFYVCVMNEKKSQIGRPKSVGNSDRKQSYTVSISAETNSKAVKIFTTRGAAIELAVKHYKTIKQLEKQK